MLGKIGRGERAPGVLLEGHREHAVDEELRADVRRAVDKGSLHGLLKEAMLSCAMLEIK